MPNECLVLTHNHTPNVHDTTRIPFYANAQLLHHSFVHLIVPHAHAATTRPTLSPTMVPFPYLSILLTSLARPFFYLRLCLCLLLLWVLRAGSKGDEPWSFMWTLFGCTQSRVEPPTAPTRFFMVFVVKLLGVVGDRERLVSCFLLSF